MDLGNEKFSMRCSKRGFQKVWHFPSQHEHFLWLQCAVPSPYPQGNIVIIWILDYVLSVLRRESCWWYCWSASWTVSASRGVSRPALWHIIRSAYRVWICQMVKPKNLNWSVDKSFPKSKMSHSFIKASRWFSSRFEFKPYHMQLSFYTVTD